VATINLAHVVTSVELVVAEIAQLPDRATQKNRTAAPLVMNGQRYCTTAIDPAGARKTAGTG
jgi:hypothetical protein